MKSAILTLLLLSLGSCQCTRPATLLTPDSTLHVIVSTSPESLDPRYTGSLVASTLSQLLFAPLFQIGEDLLPAPFLAKEVKQPDEKTYVIELKSPLYFHDGSPLTAKDVVYTFSSLSSTDVRSPKMTDFKFVESIEATSDSTLVFKLKEPHAPFLFDISGIGIVSQKHCENRSAQCRHEIMGSGPFRLRKHDKVTDTYFLVPHAQWFEGAPLLSQIEIRVVKDPTTRLLELIKGKADFAPSNVSPLQVKALEPYRERLRVERLPGLGYAYLAMNLRGPVSAAPLNQLSEKDRTRLALANVHVRHAIASAIDVNAILKAKFMGMASRATGMLPPFHWAKSNALEPIAYNPTLAKKELDEAGFLDRGKKNGGRFKVTLSTTPIHFRQSIILAYASQLRAVGIDAQVRVQDWASLYQDMKQGNFEMFSAMWTPVIDPDLMYWVFHSDNIPTPEKAGGNRGAFSDPVTDDLIIQGRKASHLEQRRFVYETLEARLLEQLPYVPLWFEDEIIVMSRDVHDFIPSRTGSLLGLKNARLERVIKRSE